MTLDTYRVQNFNTTIRSQTPTDLQVQVLSRSKTDPGLLQGLRQPRSSKDPQEVKVFSRSLRDSHPQEFQSRSRSFWGPQQVFHDSKFSGDPREIKVSKRSSAGPDPHEVQNQSRSKSSAGPGPLEVPNKSFTGPGGLQEIFSRSRPSELLGPKQVQVLRRFSGGSGLWQVFSSSSAD